ncbi:hypothetical protein OROMI_013078 [Orobanche minor]
MADQRLTRIAIVSFDKCKPKKCRQECKKNCPAVRTLKFVDEPMTHLESIASSAVRAALKVKASVIICFTSPGRAARLIAKYRPTMPILSVVIPRLKTNQLKWSFTGAFEAYASPHLRPKLNARQSLIVRGLFPLLADPRHPAESTNATNDSVLKVALDHRKALGVIKSHDRVVVPPIAIKN